MDSDDEFNSGVSSDDLGADDSSVDFGAGMLQPILSRAPHYERSRLHFDSREMKRRLYLKSGKEHHNFV